MHCQSVHEVHGKTIPHPSSLPWSFPGNYFNLPCCLCFLPTWKPLGSEKHSALCIWDAEMVASRMLWSISWSYQQISLLIRRLICVCSGFLGSRHLEEIMYRLYSTASLFPQVFSTGIFPLFVFSVQTGFTCEKSKLCMETKFLSLSILSVQLGFVFPNKNVQTCMNFFKVACYMYLPFWNNV